MGKPVARPQADSRPPTCRVPKPDGRALPASAPKSVAGIEEGKSMADPATFNEIRHAVEKAERLFATDEIDWR